MRKYWGEKVQMIPNRMCEVRSKDGKTAYEHELRRITEVEEERRTNSLSIPRIMNND